jgi:hypothetical protein
MAYEQKDGDFTLFRNEKGDNPKRPDWKGKALIDGSEYEVAAWDKRGAKGEFISGKIKVREMATKPEGGGLSGSRPRAATPDSDDVPFAPCVD